MFQHFNFDYFRLSSFKIRLCSHQWPWDAHFYKQVFRRMSVWSEPSGPLLLFTDTYVWFRFLGNVLRVYVRQVWLKITSLCIYAIFYNFHGFTCIFLYPGCIEGIDLDINKYVLDTYILLLLLYIIPVMSVSSSKNTIQTDLLFRTNSNFT